jgi:phage terminase large subunit-like protein
MSVDPQKIAASAAAAFHAATALAVSDESYKVDASQFIDSDAARWIQKHFYVPELRGPLLLADYQQQVLREALSEDGEGLFNYSTIVWSDIKKSIKSTIAAAVVLYRAWQTEWGQHYVIANDLKQADSRVGYYIRRAVELHPEMRSLVKVKNYKLELPNHTTIECIPIDPTGEAGSNADTIVFSELWGAKGKAAETMWTEMTLSPMKFGKSLRWIESYAGFKDTSKLLWNLYEQGVTSGERIDEELEMFANRRARILALWNTEPRLPWQTEAYYDQERAMLAATPEEFQRVHRNEWSEGGTERFLPSIALWDVCEEKLEPLDAHTPCVLAMDAGESNDTFATVIVSRHPEKPNLLAARYARAYVPDGNQPLDFDAIEQDIRDLCKLYAVRELAYDPMLLGQMIRRLKQKPVTVYEPFPQGAARLEADKLLLDTILQRQIAHGGYPQLREHLDNADRKVDGDGRRLRIVKREYTKKIDLAVALSMAVSRASLLLRPVHKDPELPATSGYSIFGS